jgi:hypothetical protein
VAAAGSAFARVKAAQNNSQTDRRMRKNNPANSAQYSEENSVTGIEIARMGYRIATVITYFR